MNYWPRYIGDYLRDTAHLSMAEDGCYSRLLDWLYANERPIEHARRYAVTRAVSTQDRKITDKILSEFFRRDGDLWIHGRVEKELAKLAARRAAGSKGGKTTQAKGQANDQAKGVAKHQAETPSNGASKRSSKTQAPTPEPERYASREVREPSARVVLLGDRGVG